MHIAVDLDGTLAEYHGERDPNKIGKAVPAMMDMVHTWLDAGHEVTIFTSRVSEGGDDAAIANQNITKWLSVHGLQHLKVTAIKSKTFDQFWDDRAISVQKNTGVVLTGVGTNKLNAEADHIEVDETPTDAKDTGSHYRFEYKGIKFDPARIAMIYKLKNPLQTSIVKKTLLAGERGHKGIIRDIDDIITAANRWKEIIIEDGEH